MNREEALALVRARKRSLLQARKAEVRANDKFVSAIFDAARAGASQRETAAQAGVSQPYVARVLAAAREDRLAPTSPLAKRLVDHRPEVLAILAQAGADNVRVFGSVARGEDRADSDIDLIVDVASGTGLFALGRLERSLEQLLGVHVDLIPSRLLTPRVRESVQRDLVKL